MTATTATPRPRIIHFVWIGGPLPDWARRNLDGFRLLNPDHRVRVHGEEVLLDELADLYAREQDLCVRSDLLRYSALRREGGWYLDCDFWPLRPLAEAERAWGLEPGRLYVARQHHQQNPELTLSNGVLWVHRDWPGWPIFLEEVRRAGEGPRSRVAYGPRLMLALHRRCPRLLTIGDWPWWFPADKTVSRLLWRENRAAALRTVEPATGGQLPFACHLWAGGRSELTVPEADRHGLLRRDEPTNGEPLAGVLAPSLEAWHAETKPYRPIADGLAALGYAVSARPPAEQLGLGQFRRLPEVLVAWNGRREPLATLLAGYRQAGTTVLHVEHGYLGDRERHYQLDPAGILHWSSWAREVAGDPPPGARRRLDAVLPERRPVRARRRGHILVLGQTTTDTQLADSPVASPRILERLVADNLPRGVPAIFRAHPMDRDCRGGKRLPRAGDSAAGREHYRRHKTARPGELADLVADARFVVTINSNAIHECLALGCPVLAFGPALALYAGAARQATRETMLPDLAAMADGWAPEPERVENYLAWLAARQWTIDELADPRVLREILTAAGVSLPGESPACPCPPDAGRRVRVQADREVAHD